MNRSSEPGERTQYSVAELLARYGDAAPTTGRRRRRDPEDNHTAPQSIIERVRTDSGPVPTVDPPRRRHAADAEPERYLPSWSGPEDRGSSGTEHRDLEHPEPHDTTRPAATRSDPTRSDPTYSDPQRNGHHRPETDGSGRDFFGPEWQLDRLGRSDHGNRDWGSGSWAELDGGGPGPAALNGHPPGIPGPAPTALNGHPRDSYRSGAGLNDDTWVGLPPPGAEPEPLSGRVPVGGPPTDQLPRLDPALLDSAPLHPALLDSAPLDSASLDPALQDPAPLDPAALADHWPDGGEPPAGLSTSTQLISQHKDDRLAEAAEPAWDDTELADAEVLAGQQDPDFDEEPEQFGSPIREWVVMVTQISFGVVGGALLWLICEWLWQRIPIVALVVALAVITGLVWVVRRVRRAEDLQTTVIAVLVGLFVTVSPAALLLVGR